MVKPDQTKIHPLQTSESEGMAEVAGQKMLCEEIGNYFKQPMKLYITERAPHEIFPMHI